MIPGAKKTNYELDEEKRQLEQKKRKLEINLKNANKENEEMEDHLKEVNENLNATKGFEEDKNEINSLVQKKKRLEADIGYISSRIKEYEGQIKEVNEQLSVSVGDCFFHWAYGPLNVIEIYNKYDTQYGCDIDRYILEPMAPEGIVYPIKGTAYPNRRFRKEDIGIEDIGIWLHRNSEDIYKSPYFAPILAHRSYDIHSA